MRIQIQFRIIGDDNSVISEDEILQFDKDDDRLEAIGLSFANSKAILVGIQERVVSAQAATYIENNIGAIPDYSERWHNGERRAFWSGIGAVISAAEGC